MRHAELARLLGVSRSVVTRCAARGMPVDDIEAAREWRRDHVAPRLKATPDHDAQYQAARINRAGSEAEIMRLRVEAAKALVGSVAGFYRALNEAQAMLAAELPKIAARASVEIAPCSNPIMVEAILTRHIIDGLHNVAQLAGEAAQSGTSGKPASSGVSA